PVAIRMWLAALSTVAFGAALVASSVASVAQAPTDVSRGASSLLALVAGLGYFLAFLTPGPVRRVWQARTTGEYTRLLIADSSEPVGVIWKGFTDLAVRMQGGAALIIVGTKPGAAAVAASTGIDDVALGEPIGWDDLESVIGAARSGWDMPAAKVGPIRRQLAEASGARFVSVVPIDVPHSDETAVLILLSAHRTLFHVSDFDLFRALGGQTAIVAERRAVMAEQEALAARLESTVEALRSASAAKSDFVASMSHEFRTPLSAILGFSELMDGEPRDGDRVSVPIEWVDHIHRGGQHLLALVNDVLDLARVEAGRLDLRPEPIEVASAVTEAVNGLRPLADRKGIRIETRAPLLTVVADRGRFRQILYNLVSNAIKYTPDGGHIRIEASHLDGEVRVSVTDDGVGIDPSGSASRSPSASPRRTTAEWSWCRRSGRGARSRWSSRRRSTRARRWRPGPTPGGRWPRPPSTPSRRWWRQATSSSSKMTRARSDSCASTWRPPATQCVSRRPARAASPRSSSASRPRSSSTSSCPGSTAGRCCGGSRRTTAPTTCR
ncbi:MAG: HAMP domain-containing histidine kinase, partial [Chloroflexi bacterium]|nr:HAMP domain-containing histidine kinase [Chloroflexota bacterium]